MADMAENSRWRFVWDCINPKLKWLFSGFTVLSGATWVRDEFLDKPYRDIRVLDLLPNWPVYLWTTLFLLIIGIAFVEGVYQHVHANRKTKTVFDADGKVYRRLPKRSLPNSLGIPGAIVAAIALLWIGYPTRQMKIEAGPAPVSKLEQASAKPSEPVPTVHETAESIANKVMPPILKMGSPPSTRKDLPVEPKVTIPTEPKETITAVLIKMCPVPSPEIGRFPARFIPEWIHRLNGVRLERPKLDLQAVIQKMGGPPRQGPPMKELVAEAKFTLRCLASEGYVRIKETTVLGKWYGVEFDNLEFEFVPEKLNQFTEGL